jgi:cytochrome c oxidase assembly protein subunit 15
VFQSFVDDQSIDHGVDPMTESPDRAITGWLLTVCALIVVMVVFGGYVRLTRSGLSIVEWKPVSGVIPPIGEDAWQAEFAKYQESPEYQKVNRHFTLDEYKRIFYVEYIHRLIARIAGLIVVIPLFVYVLRGRIPWRKSGMYWLIAALFGFQGFLGWYMVSSGLEDRPAVSHFRLTIHLLTALFLLALTLWMALNRIYGREDRVPKAERSSAYGWTWLLMAVLVVQIAYGGLVAGLKAGHVSNTWPLMFGYLVPPGLLAIVQPWWKNLFEAATTVHFMHRWFAFVVLIAALVVWAQARRANADDATRRGAAALVGLASLQIALGIGVVWFGVPLWLALLHQANALFLFIDGIYMLHRLQTQERSAPVTALATGAR